MKPIAQKVCLVAISVALALVISLIEGMLPLSFIPVPGAKLGLANIITLFVLCFSGARYAFIVVILRCILTAAFSGSVTAFCFSVCGGLLALIIMAFLLKTRKFSLGGVSIAGAAMHSVGQIIAAALMLSGFSVIFYLPFLLFCSIFTGAITGVLTHILFNRLSKINYFKKLTV